MSGFNDYFEPQEFKSSRGNRQLVKERSMRDYADDADDSNIPIQNLKIPKISQAAAQNAKTASFQPFADDSDKHGRYLAFLDYQQSLNSLEEYQKFVGSQGLSSVELQLEFKEFTQICSLFTSLSSRFTSTSTVSTFSDIPISRTEDEKEELKDEKQVVNKRTIEDWAVDGLVCKRFNIAYSQLAPKALLSVAQVFDKQQSKNHRHQTMGKGEEKKKESKMHSGPLLPFRQESGGHDFVFD